VLGLGIRLRLGVKVKVKVGISFTVMVSVSVNNNNSGADELADKYRLKFLPSCRANRVALISVSLDLLPDASSHCQTTFDRRIVHRAVCPFTSRGAFGRIYCDYLGSDGQNELTGVTGYIWDRRT